MKVAEIYLNQKNKRIDQPYDYKIPEDKETVIVPGIRVTVGFGRGNRQLEGFVIHIKDETEFPDKIKEIKTIIDKEPILTEEQIALCVWMKSYYCSLFYEALSHFANPVKIVKRSIASEEDPRKTVISFETYRSKEKVYRLLKTEKVKGKVQAKILLMLKNRDYTRKELRDLLGEVGSSIRSLEKKGCIEAYERDTGVFCKNEDSLMPIHLSVQEENLYTSYCDSKNEKKICFINESHSTIKFNVYCKIIMECLKNEKTALVLFPEVGLTIEKKEQLYRFFGNVVALYHGQMNQKEKYQLFQRIRCGEIKVLVGSRAAMFMPMRDLGLIIVEEERDLSYYAVSMPKYNTVDVAEKYAELCEADLVISDEIPSVTALYKVKKKQWSSATFLEESVKTKRPNYCDVIDMQQEMKNGNYDFMSVRLKKELDKALSEQKLALLMINKRGYASYVFCRNCGYVEKCPVCGVALKYHTGNDVLKCHYCGYTKRNRHVCPSCSKRKMKELGLGIDQVQQLLEKRYPKQRILKLDSSTVPNLETFKRINDELFQKQWDIVLGTRMMLGNFKYTNVGLGAALLIDSDLNHGDYNSSENAYQLYCKFLKRVDRTDGVRLIQTYEPENSTVEALIKDDINFFYDNEIIYRSLLGYPPVQHLILFSLFHPESDWVRSDSKNFYKVLYRINHLYGEDKVKIFEPVLSGFIKGNGQTCWKIVLKTKYLRFFYQIIEKILETGEIEALESKVSIEIDPPVTL
ncbi:MAG: primosomal protein N' [Eubacterium sp.]